MEKKAHHGHGVEAFHWIRDPAESLIRRPAEGTARPPVKSASLCSEDQGD